MASVATFAGGCFWCIEAAFKSLRGVSAAASGFMGGAVPNPTYKDVCTGTTNHAEVVQVSFDESVIKYPELLQLFWRMHDPTTLNRQGNDVGTQYRSAIFYHTEEQHKLAELSKQAAAEAKLFDSPIVTQIVPATTFYPAEDYHQDYYKNNPDQGYCRAVVGPKLKKFKELFKDKLNENH